MFSIKIFCRDNFDSTEPKWLFVKSESGFSITLKKFTSKEDADKFVQLNKLSRCGNFSADNKQEICGYLICNTDTMNSFIAINSEITVYQDGINLHIDNDWKV